MKAFKPLITGVALVCASATHGVSATSDMAWTTLLAGHDVVLLGEIHDNPAHHVRQAEAIAALSPKAVVFEMLSPEQAVLLAVGIPDDAAEAAALLNWAASGWPDYIMYHPVFLASRDAAIYGAALPREKVRAAVFGDVAALFGTEAAQFGLDQPLPAKDQSEREAMQMSAHCDALPGDMLPGMVAAQRLRDAHFARVTVQALAETGGPVAVITGNGHARKDWGVPVYLAAAAPEIRVITVGQFEERPDPDAPFDVTLSAAPAERPDPCIAFR
jgi:uncharacterized iron-regulated protein